MDELEEAGQIGEEPSAVVDATGQAEDTSGTGGVTTKMSTGPLSPGPAASVTNRRASKPDITNSVWTSSLSNVAEESAVEAAAGAKSVGSESGSPSSLINRRMLGKKSKSASNIVVPTEGASTRSIDELKDVNEEDISRVFLARTNGANVMQYSEFSKLIGEALGWAVSEYTAVNPPPVLPSTVFRSLLNEAQRHEDGGSFTSINHKALTDNAFQYFDLDQDGVIDSTDYTNVLAHLIQNSNDARSRFAFQLYDTKGDNLIDRDELFDFLKLFFTGGIQLGIQLVSAYPEAFLDAVKAERGIVPEGNREFHEMMVDHLKGMHDFTDHCADEELNMLVKQAFDEVEARGQDAISFEDFSRYIGEANLEWVDTVVQYLCKPQFGMK